MTPMQRGAREANEESAALGSKAAISDLSRRIQELTSQLAEKPKPRVRQEVTLTARQIQVALAWALPDGSDADALDAEWVIGWTPGTVASDPDDTVNPGWVMWMGDYPEEGCLSLDVPAEVRSPAGPQNSARPNDPNAREEIEGDQL